MLYSTRLVVCLLALMQMIAPLVHAHVGGARATGSLHLPGLEFLSQPRESQVQLSAGRDLYDVVVSVAAGLEQHGDPIVPHSSPDPAAVLHGTPALTADSALALTIERRLAAPTPSWRVSLSFSPRAPPIHAV